MAITKEQKEGMLGKIGGSNVATILGLNPHETPHKWWLQNRLDPEKRVVFDDDGGDPAWWGNWIEPGVVQKVNEDYPEMEITPYQDDLTFRGYPMFRGHIDGRRLKVNRGVEVKTTSVLVDKSGAPLWGEPGTNQIPDYAHCQSQFYMGSDQLAEVEGFDIPMFYFPRRATTLYVSERKADQIARMYDFLAEWHYKYIIGDTPPPPVNADDVISMYPNSAGQIITNNEITQTVIGLRAIKKNIKDLDGEKKKAEFLIKRHMGEHAMLVDLEGKPLTTWKTTTSNRFDQKKFKEAEPEQYASYKTESTTRRFLVK